MNTERQSFKTYLYLHSNPVIDLQIDSST